MARVLFIGAVHEALPAFSALCDSPDADVVGLVTLSETSTVSGGVDLLTLAASRGVTPQILADANSPMLVQDLAPFEADVAFVVGWNRLIPRNILELFPLGVYGFHASPLPQDRGRAPVNWAIIRGDTRTANTMMRLAPGVDLGDIVDQRFTPIFQDDTCATVYERIGQLGVQMIYTNLAEILAGRPPLRRQNPDEGNYLTKRTPDMGVVDWTMSPTQLHNWIRAQTIPYPGAFSDLAGQKVMIWSSKPPTVRDNLGGGARPGTVIGVNEGRIVVQAGLGSIELTSLSWENGQTLGDEHLTLGTVFSQPKAEWVEWARGVGERPRALNFGGGR